LKVGGPAGDRIKMQVSSTNVWGDLAGLA